MADCADLLDCAVFLPVGQYALPGTATTSPGWAIQFITYDTNGNTLSTQWSPLYASFGDTWSTRTTLSYS